MEKAATDRMQSSRLSMLDSSYSQSRSGFDKHADDTNRRYFKKVLTLLANLVQLAIQDTLDSPAYSPEPLQPFFLDFLDLAEVGLVDFFNTSQQSESHSG